MTKIAALWLDALSLGSVIAACKSWLVNRCSVEINFLFLFRLCICIGLFAAVLFAFFFVCACVCFFCCWWWFACVSRRQLLLGKDFLWERLFFHHWGTRDVEIASALRPDETKSLSSTQSSTITSSPSLHASASIITATTTTTMMPAAVAPAAVTMPPQSLTINSQRDNNKQPWRVLFSQRAALEQNWHNGSYHHHTIKVKNVIGVSVHPTKNELLLLRQEDGKFYVELWTCLSSHMAATPITTTTTTIATTATTPIIMNNDPPKISCADESKKWRLDRCMPITNLCTYGVRTFSVDWECRHFVIRAELDHGFLYNFHNYVKFSFCVSENAAMTLRCGYLCYTNRIFGGPSNVCVYGPFLSRGGDYALRMTTTGSATANTTVDLHTTSGFGVSAVPSSLSASQTTIETWWLPKRTWFLPNYAGVTSLTILLPPRQSVSSSIEPSSRRHQHQQASFLETLSPRAGSSPLLIVGGSDDVIRIYSCGDLPQRRDITQTALPPLPLLEVFANARIRSLFVDTEHDRIVAWCASHEDSTNWIRTWPLTWAKSSHTRPLLKETTRLHNSMRCEFAHNGGRYWVSCCRRISDSSASNSKETVAQHSRSSGGHTVLSQKGASSLLPPPPSHVLRVLNAATGRKCAWHITLSAEQIRNVVATSTTLVATTECEVNIWDFSTN